MVNIGAEVDFNLLVHSPHLSVHLRVEGCTGVHLDTDHAIELLHELQDKLWSLVTDNFLWNSMVMENMVTEYLSSTKSGQIKADWFDESSFCELVDNDQD